MDRECQDCPHLDEGCEFDNDDPDDWKDIGEEWVSEQKESIKTPKRRRRSTERFPEFNWTEFKQLRLPAVPGVITCIEHAEKGRIPKEGLTFRYADVAFQSLSEFSKTALQIIRKEAEDSNTSRQHKMFHNYIVEIINWHLDD